MRKERQVLVLLVDAVFPIHQHLAKHWPNLMPVLILIQIGEYH
jgi:hypothetical protein